MQQPRISNSTEVQEAAATMSAISATIPKFQMFPPSIQESTSNIKRNSKIESKAKSNRKGNKKRKAKTPAGRGTSIVAITSSEDLNTKPKPPTAPPPKAKPPKDTKEALETELAHVSATVHGGELSEGENEYL